MKTLARIGTVLAGYVAALLAATAAVAIRIANTSGPEADASTGMYAFGDGLLFIAVFGAVAILPTGLALYFLRPCRWFWGALSAAALAIAATALVAAAVYAVPAHLTLPQNSPRMAGAALAVLRMLAAGGSEDAVAAFAVLHWFVGAGFI